MWKVYGLTGGIGSGKSTVARFFSDHGATVIDADLVAREVVAPGEPALDQIVEAFGEDFLADDGTLNREKLGALVFEDETARETLNGIVHPAIASRSGALMLEAMSRPEGPVFYEAALLVENRAWEQFAGLIVVTAPPELQIERVMARNGLSQRDAEKRLASQLPMSEKVAVADYVIDNSGTLEELKNASLELLHKLRNA